MIAITQMAKSKILIKSKIQNTKNRIQNDDQVQVNKQTWSEKNIHLEMDKSKFFANHVISKNDGIDDDKLVAFSSSFCKVTPAMCKMDTDSFAVGVDSYASRCISPFINDFIKGSLRPLMISKTVRPFGQGKGLNIIMIGILIWKFQDNDGVTHTFKI